MKFERVRAAVAGIPHMTPAQGAAIMEFIIAHAFNDVLELGFRHGVSTCYLAAALDELGRGRVTTVDLTGARAHRPNIDTLLAELGLADYVTAYFEPTSYTWRLMRMLERNSAPQFDFCYIDGAHDWFTDGFAFFLVDRLLRPGGWILFDDLNWTYDTSPALKRSEFVRAMPADQRCTPQIRNVVELLVKPHPAYGEIREIDGWAYARKSPATPAAPAAVKREVIERTEYVGLARWFVRWRRRRSDRPRRLQ